MILIKHLEMNQIMALNNPEGVDCHLVNQTKQNQTTILTPPHKL